MGRYFIANEKVNFGFYPNYSFELGDINGDGRKEFIALDQKGNLLKVMDLDGDTLFTRGLDNNGNWGTPLVCALDIDDDGKDEIIAPDGNKIIAVDINGRTVSEYIFPSAKKDDFGINIPLLTTAKIHSPAGPAIVAAVAGGEIIAIDRHFNLIWKTGGFFNDFGHEFFVADADGDGLDEIAFCTLDHINGGRGAGGYNRNAFVLLDHDGNVLINKPVDALFDDTHFDDVAMAGFLGDGKCQILLEKGVLLDLKGEVVWDASKLMDHGQWIAHMPNPVGKGRLAFIAELWGVELKSMLLDGAGAKRWDISGFPWPNLKSEEYILNDAAVLPSRCHAVQWAPNADCEIFLAQQPKTSGTHECTNTLSFGCEALFMDLSGKLLAQLPYVDTQIESYFYNGEVHSKVADIDGDGRPEIVFPKQDGRVMIIKKT